MDGAPDAAKPDNGGANLAPRPMETVLAAAAALRKTPQDIKARYASASFLGRNRVVFNIKGNDYRLVVAVAYRFAAVYVKFVGTHAQYDAIQALTVESKP